MMGHWMDRGDLWKNKARSLQFQLRDRLRVTVDRRIRRPIFSDDGYLSSTMKRWLQRFRNFRRDSLASSSAFYRRRVNKDVFVEENSVVTRILQAVAVPVLGTVCHVYMHGLNRVQVYGAEKLHSALLNRPKDKPLVTVSNHVASMDDPLVIASLLPVRVLMDAHSLRWTLCATDRCFKNPVTSAFFRSVKVLPVARGDGIYQKGLDSAVSKLNDGGWVHIFPEGSRSRDGGRTMGSAKRGVGRLVLDADNIPVVIPFVHNGMQEVMPIGTNFPKIGKTVTVLIGDPIDFNDLLNLEGPELESRGNLYDAVSARISNRLLELKVQVDTLATDRQSLQTENRLLAASWLQQSEWGEPFGVDSYMNSLDISESVKKPTEDQLNPVLSQKFSSSKQFPTVGSCYENGFVSGIRATEMMGFAARGLFHQFQEKSARIREVTSPLKAWKQFVEANVVPYSKYSNLAA